MTSEREVRDLARQMGLTVRHYGERIVLRERYGKHKIIASFRSWFSVKRAIMRYARKKEVALHLSGREVKRRRH